MQLEIILNILMVGTGIVLCIQDIIRQSVNLWILMIFTIGCCSKLVYGHPPCYWLFVIIITIGLIYRIIRRGPVFGLADYIVTFAISFVIPPDGWRMFLMICGGIGIIIGFIQKSSYRADHIPFIPALLLSALITNILLS